MLVHRKSKNYYCIFDETGKVKSIFSHNPLKSKTKQQLDNLQETRKFNKFGKNIYLELNFILIGRCREYHAFGGLSLA